jgi:hypothetical protein
MPLEIEFFADSVEWAKAQHATSHGGAHRDWIREHRDYVCGACSKHTNGRLVATYQQPSNGAKVSLCVCSCPKAEPTIITEIGGKMIAQIPESREFQVGENWPKELADLFMEASHSFAAGAPTGVAMICRKVLMACAFKEGDAAGKNFVEYVDYIVNTVLNFPRAKTAIDKIRGIGNEANHEIHFVTREDAKRALLIVNYMLNTIYSLPAS